MDGMDIMTTVILLTIGGLLVWMCWMAFSPVGCRKGCSCRQRNFFMRWLLSEPKKKH